MSAESEQRHDIAALRRLVREWGSFVRRVENGYDDSIYDFTNDLSARDSLAELLALLPAAEGPELRAELRGWDERYDKATRPSLRPLAAGVTEGDRSWWYRLPLRPKGELAADLRSQGWID